MISKMIISTTLWLAAMAALLFVSAGTVRWPQGWIFLVEMGVAAFAGGFWLARHDPGLLAERLGSPIQRGQERSDKIFMAVLILLWVAWFVLMPIDAVRLRLTQLPVWAQAVGALLIALSMVGFYLTFRENSFAAPVVKIQKERGQTVVATGPYRYVRHPMYASAILYLVGMPLLFGSEYGLAFVPVLVVLLALRIGIEERALRAGLDGYAQYAARVRYRLIPGIW
jgi:protein-S-isoprenylcysteine O-methyltransferase Ste14